MLNRWEGSWKHNFQNELQEPLESRKKTLHNFLLDLKRLCKSNGGYMLEPSPPKNPLHPLNLDESSFTRIVERQAHINSLKFDNDDYDFHSKKIRDSRSVSHLIPYDLVFNCCKLSGSPPSLLPLSTQRLLLSKLRHTRFALEGEGISFLDNSSEGEASLELGGLSKRYESRKNCHLHSGFPVEFPEHSSLENAPLPPRRSLKKAISRASPNVKAPYPAGKVPSVFSLLSFALSCDVASDEPSNETPGSDNEAAAYSSTLFPPSAYSSFEDCSNSHTFSSKKELEKTLAKTVNLPVEDCCEYEGNRRERDIHCKIGKEGKIENLLVLHEDDPGEGDEEPSKSGFSSCQPLSKTPLLSSTYEDADGDSAIDLQARSFPPSWSESSSKIMSVVCCEKGGEENEEVIGREMGVLRSEYPPDKEVIGKETRALTSENPAPKDAGFHVQNEEKELPIYSLKQTRESIGVLRTGQPTRTTRSGRYSLMAAPHFRENPVPTAKPCQPHLVKHTHTQGSSALSVWNNEVNGMIANLAEVGVKGEDKKASIEAKKNGRFEEDKNHEAIEGGIQRKLSEGRKRSLFENELGAATGAKGREEKVKLLRNASQLKALTHPTHAIDSKCRKSSYLNGNAARGGSFFRIFFTRKMMRDFTRQISFGLSSLKKSSCSSVSSNNSLWSISESLKFNSRLSRRIDSIPNEAYEKVDEHAKSGFYEDDEARSKKNCRSPLFSYETRDSNTISSEDIFPSIRDIGNTLEEDRVRNFLHSWSSSVSSPSLGCSSSKLKEKVLRELLSSNYHFEKRNAAKFSDDRNFHLHGKLLDRFAVTDEDNPPEGIPPREVVATSMEGKEGVFQAQNLRKRGRDSINGYSPLASMQTVIFGKLQNRRLLLNPIKDYSEKKRQMELKKVEAEADRKKQMELKKAEELEAGKGGKSLEKTCIIEEKAYQQSWDEGKVASCSERLSCEDFSTVAIKKTENTYESPLSTLVSSAVELRRGGSSLILSSSFSETSCPCDSSQSAPSQPVGSRISHRKDVPSAPKSLAVSHDKNEVSTKESASSRLVSSALDPTLSLFCSSNQSLVSDTRNPLISCLDSTTEKERQTHAFLAYGSQGRHCDKSFPAEGFRRIGCQIGKGVRDSSFSSTGCDTMLASHQPQTEGDHLLLWPTSIQGEREFPGENAHITGKAINESLPKGEETPCIEGLKESMPQNPQRYRHNLMRFFISDSAINEALIKRSFPQAESFYTLPARGLYVGGARGIGFDVRPFSILVASGSAATTVSEGQSHTTLKAGSTKTCSPERSLENEEQVSSSKDEKYLYFISNSDEDCWSSKNSSSWQSGVGCTAFCMAGVLPTNLFSWDSLELESRNEAALCFPLEDDGSQLKQKAGSSCSLQEAAVSNLRFETDEDFSQKTPSSYKTPSSNLNNILSSIPSMIPAYQVPKDDSFPTDGETLNAKLGTPRLDSSNPSSHVEKCLDNPSTLSTSTSLGVLNLHLASAKADASPSMHACSGEEHELQKVPSCSYSPLRPCVVPSSAIPFDERTAKHGKHFPFVEDDFKGLLDSCTLQAKSSVLSSSCNLVNGDAVSFRSTSLHSESGGVDSLKMGNKASFSDESRDEISLHNATEKHLCRNPLLDGKKATFLREDSSQALSRASSSSQLPKSEALNAVAQTEGRFSLTFGDSKSKLAPQSTDYSMKIGKISSPSDDNEESLENTLRSIAFSGLLDANVCRKTKFNSRIGQQRLIDDESKVLKTMKSSGMTHRSRVFVEKLHFDDIRAVYCFIIPSLPYSCSQPNNTERIESMESLMRDISQTADLSCSLSVLALGSQEQGWGCGYHTGNGKVVKGGVNQASSLSELPTLEYLHNKDLDDYHEEENSDASNTLTSPLLQKMASSLASENSPLSQIPVIDMGDMISLVKATSLTSSHTQQSTVQPPPSSSLCLSSSSQLCMLFFVFKRCVSIPLRLPASLATSEPQANESRVFAEKQPGSRYHLEIDKKVCEDGSLRDCNTHSDADYQVRKEETEEVDICYDEAENVSSSFGCDGAHHSDSITHGDLQDEDKAQRGPISTPVIQDASTSKDVLLPGNHWVACCVSVDCVDVLVHQLIVMFGCKFKTWDACAPLGASSFENERKTTFPKKGAFYDESDGFLATDGIAKDDAAPVCVETSNLNRANLSEGSKLFATGSDTGCIANVHEEALQGADASDDAKEHTCFANNGPYSTAPTHTTSYANSATTATAEICFIDEEVKTTPADFSAAMLSDPTSSSKALIHTIHTNTHPESSTTSSNSAIIKPKSLSSPFLTPFSSSSSITPSMHADDGIFPDSSINSMVAKEEIHSFSIESNNEVEKAFPPASDVFMGIKAVKLGATMKGKNTTYKEKPAKAYGNEMMPFANTCGSSSSTCPGASVLDLSFSPSSASLSFIESLTESEASSMKEIERNTPNWNPQKLTHTSSAMETSPQSQLPTFSDEDAAISRELRTHHDTLRNSPSVEDRSSPFSAASILKVKEGVETAQNGSKTGKNTFCEAFSPGTSDFSKANTKMNMLYVQDSWLKMRKAGFSSSPFYTSALSKAQLDLYSQTFYTKMKRYFSGSRGYPFSRMIEHRECLSEAVVKLSLGSVISTLNQATPALIPDSLDSRATEEEASSSRYKAVFRTDLTSFSSSSKTSKPRSSQRRIHHDAAGATSLKEQPCEPKKPKAFHLGNFVPSSHYSSFYVSLRALIYLLEQLLWLEFLSFCRRGNKEIIKREKKTHSSPPSYSCCPDFGVMIRAAKKSLVSRNQHPVSEALDVLCSHEKNVFEEELSARISRVSKEDTTSSTHLDEKALLLRANRRFPKRLSSSSFGEDQPPSPRSFDSGEEMYATMAAPSSSRVFSLSLREKRQQLAHPLTPRNGVKRVGNFKDGKKKRYLTRYDKQNLQSSSHDLTPITLGTEEEEEEGKTRSSSSSFLGRSKCDYEGNQTKASLSSAKPLLKFAATGGSKKPSAPLQERDEVCALGGPHTTESTSLCAADLKESQEMASNFKLKRRKKTFDLMENEAWQERDHDVVAFKVKKAIIPLKRSFGFLPFVETSNMRIGDDLLLTSKDLDTIWKEVMQKVNPLDLQIS